MPKIMTVGRAFPAVGVVAASVGLTLRVGLGVPPPVKGDWIRVGVGVADGWGNWAKIEDEDKTKRAKEMALARVKETILGSRTLVSNISYLP